MRRVIVTGANGFIGSSLIKRLIDKNIEVIALDISFANSVLPKTNLITEIETNLDDFKKIERIIPSNEYDTFYHLAWAGVNGQMKTDPLVQLDNIKMAINCAIVAKKLKCNKYLCAGTIAERAVDSLFKLDKTSGGMMYGTSKYACHLILETYCKNIGLNFIWMQFSNIYGPENKTGNLVSYTIRELARGNEASFGPANQPYDFIFVDDLIEAIIRLGENETCKNFYFIGSGEPRILKDYLFEIGSQLGMENLIKIDSRPDDGIEYSLEMFNINDLEEDIGNYISKSFSEGIEYTIENF